MTLPKADEQYYRNTINDFGLGAPLDSYTQEFSILNDTTTELMLDNEVQPGSYTTVRRNNLVLHPSTYYTAGRTVTFIAPFTTGDAVVVAYEKLDPAAPIGF